MDDLKRHVVGLDRDGKILWTKAVPSVLPDSPRIREGHGYASSTPVAEPGRLYVFFGKSGVFAFDLDGKQLWHAGVGEGTSGWGSAASPILVGDTLIVNASVESRSLIALDKATGKQRWRAGGIKESWNTPILVTTGDGKTELALAIHGKVLGFNPATGEQLWACDTDIGWYMVPSLVAHEGGEQLWACDTDIGWYMVPSLVAHEGIVYCIGGRGRGGGTGSDRPDRTCGTPAPALVPKLLLGNRGSPKLCFGTRARREPRRSCVPKRELGTCLASATGPAPTDLASVEPGIGHYRQVVVNHRPTEASSVVAGVASKRVRSLGTRDIL